MTKIPRKALVGGFESGIPVHYTFDANNVLVSPLGESIQLGATLTSGVVYADSAARLDAENVYVVGDIGKLYKQESDNTLWILSAIVPAVEWKAVGAADQISELVFEDTAAREAEAVSEPDIGKIARQLDDNSLWMLVGTDPIVWARIGDGGNAAMVDGKAPGVASGLAVLDENNELASEHIPAALAKTADLGDAAFKNVGTGAEDVAVGSHAHTEYVPSSIIGDIAENPLTLAEVEIPASFATNTGAVEARHFAPADVDTVSDFATTLNLKSGTTIQEVFLFLRDGTKNVGRIDLTPVTGNTYSANPPLSLSSKNGTPKLGSPVVITNTFSQSPLITGNMLSYTAIRVTITHTGDLYSMPIVIKDDQDNVIVSSTMFYDMYMGFSYSYSSGGNTLNIQINDFFGPSSNGIAYDATIDCQVVDAPDRYFIGVKIDGTSHYILGDGTDYVGFTLDSGNSIIPGMSLGALSSSFTPEKNVVSLLGTSGYDESFFDNKQSVYDVFDNIKDKLIERPRTVDLGDAAFKNVGVGTEDVASGFVVGDIGNNPIDLTVPAQTVSNSDDVEVAHIAPADVATPSIFKTVINKKAGTSLVNIAIKGASETVINNSQTISLLPVDGEVDSYASVSTNLQSLNMLGSFPTTPTTVITNDFVTRGASVSVNGTLDPVITSLKIVMIMSGGNISLTLRDQNDTELLVEDMFADMFTNNYSTQYYSGNYAYGLGIDVIGGMSLQDGDVYDVIHEVAPGVVVDRYFITMTLDGTELFIGNDGSVSDGSDASLGIIPGTELGAFPVYTDKTLVNLLGTVGFDDAFFDNKKTIYGVLNNVKDKLLNIDAAQMTSGLIDIARIPPAAIERLVVVADEVAKYNLTINEVQLGDVVKQSTDGKMFAVVDTSKLDSVDGYVEYSVGLASAVPWAGVQNKPTSLLGYGITDAAPSSHVGSTGAAHGAVTTGANGFMIAADKSKLDNIEAGAQVNVGTDISYGIKTSIDFQLISSTGNTLTIFAANDTEAGLMTSFDRTKLNGIEEGAQVNVGTNITFGTRDGVSMMLESNTGSGVLIGIANDVLAGLMSSADKSKLDAISAATNAPAPAGVAAAVGTSTAYAREDHVHPSRIATTAPASPVNGDIWIA